MDVQDQGARTLYATASVTIDRTTLLDAVIGLTRQAKALAAHANEPSAFLHLARAILALKTGRSQPPAGKDKDVAIMLMRMALVLLDCAEECDAAVYAQQAIDILIDAPAEAADAAIDDDLFDALFPIVRNTHGSEPNQSRHLPD